MTIDLRYHFLGAGSLVGHWAKVLLKNLWEPLILLAICPLTHGVYFLCPCLYVLASILIARKIVPFMDIGIFIYEPWGEKDFIFFLRYSALFLLPLSIMILIISTLGIEIPIYLMFFGSMLALFFLMLPISCACILYCFSSYHQKPLKFKEAFTLARGNNLKFGLYLITGALTIFFLSNPSALKQVWTNVFSAIMTPFVSLSMIIFCTSVFLSLVNRKDYYEK